MHDIQHAMENEWDTQTSSIAAQKRNPVTVVFATLGFIAIIGIGIWGSIQVAKSIPGLFSSVASVAGSKNTNATSTAPSTTPTNTVSGEAIALSAPSLTVQSKSAFVLSWTHKNKTANGSYTFRYDCANGVFFTTPASLSGAATTIYCNIPFNFLNTNNSITITPISETASPVDVNVYVDFAPNGTLKPTVGGRLGLTVTGGGATAPNPTPGTGTTYISTVTGGIRRSDPNGYVDLRVRALEAGTVDVNGTFTPNPTPSQRSRVAVRFVVDNIGTKTSPQFSFNALLPTYPQRNFASPTEQGLQPGEITEFVIGFDGFDAYNSNNMVSITVDPSNLISESDKSNNTINYTVSTTP